MKDVNDLICGYSCYPHLKSSTAEMSFDPASLEQKVVDSWVILKEHECYDASSEKSAYVHEFLVCGILDFQRNQQVAKTRHD